MLLFCKEYSIFVKYFTKIEIVLFKKKKCWISLNMRVPNEAHFCKKEKHLRQACWFLVYQYFTYKVLPKLNKAGAKMHLQLNSII